jgi:hypothetical protein
VVLEPGVGAKTPAPLVNAGIPIIPVEQPPAAGIDRTTHGIEEIGKPGVGDRQPVDQEGGQGDAVGGTFIGGSGIAAHDESSGAYGHHLRRVGGRSSAQPNRAGTGREGQQTRLSVPEDDQKETPQEGQRRA